MIKVQLDELLLCKNACSSSTIRFYSCSWLLKWSKKKKHVQYIWLPNTVPQHSGEYTEWYYCNRKLYPQSVFLLFRRFFPSVHKSIAAVAACASFNVSTLLCLIVEATACHCVDCLFYFVRSKERGRGQGGKCTISGSPEKRKGGRMVLLGCLGGFSYDYLWACAA